MDKFQTELLAQFKEHNRLTKELVKIERANFELSKDINNVNSILANNIVPHIHHTDPLGTYCGVDSGVADMHAYINTDIRKQEADTKGDEQNA